MLIDRLVLTHDALQEDFTTRKLSLRAELPNSDISSYARSIPNSHESPPTGKSLDSRAKRVMRD